MSVAALVLGAGSGERLRESLSAAPSGAEGEAALAYGKAFVRLEGRSLLARSLSALLASGEVESAVPVLAPAALGHFDAVWEELGRDGRVAPPVAGGARRQDSVRLGLAALAPGVTHVAVHDAARPLVRAEDVAAVVRAARRHGAAILAAPLADTLHRVRDDRLVDTPPRDACRAAQTPQVFRVDWLREALAKAEANGVVVSDDAAALVRIGLPVHVVAGDPANLKITRAADLLVAAALLRARREGAS